MNRCVVPIVCVVVAFICPAALRGQNAQDATEKARVLSQQAQQYLAEQKPQLAIPLLRQILSLEPNNFEARGNLGVLLFFQEKYSEAITQLRAVLQAQPDLWKLRMLLGMAEKRTGDPVAAQADLEQAFANLDDKKVQTQAGLELVEVTSASGQLDKAASVTAKLQSIAPRDPQVLFAAYQISLQMMEQSLLSMVIAAPDSAEMHMMMANQFVLQGDTSNAIAQYREAIKLNPRMPGVHFELAEQLKNSSDPALNAQAEAEYKAALDVNQYDEKAWRQLGELMTAKGDLSAARDDYSRALSLQPGDADAETGLANVLVSLKETDKAMSLLESAVKNDPTNLVAHYHLSTLYRQRGRTADAKREMDIFLHYKALKDKLGKVFLNMRSPKDASKAAGHEHIQ
jgi:tetratricopeptide (TPR) repeat protein